MKKLTQKIQQGFTLIELLIVIAVLGVLATVVLVAINPLEQLSRGEDSGRKSSVAQLGHAMQAYFTAQNAQTYPAATPTWQTTLQTAGEISQILSAPLNTKGNCTTNNQGNYCYASTGTDAVIWTIIESRSDTVKALGACLTAPATNFAAATWNARFGKEGLVCLGAAAATQPPYATEPI